MKGQQGRQGEGKYTFISQVRFAILKPGEALMSKTPVELLQKKYSKVLLYIT